jgi:bifunctional DNA-binding transcriptional regulator/antitoxin component of YhaV-PrlF toxin-antitoxin module
MSKIVDTCVVQDSYRITLTAYVRKKLKLDVGDTVAYVEDEKGNILVKKAEVRV